MTIRRKIIRLLVTLTILFAIGVFISDWFESRKLNEFLKTFRGEKAIDLDKSIESNGTSLKTFAYDYTYWNEMVDFVKHRDLKWAYENIEAVMPTFNTHGVWIFEPDFDLVYSVNAPGLGSLKGLPFSKKELREIFAQSHFRHFFMCHDSLLCEFRTAPIQPSDDLDRVTPPRGYFLASRCWTKEALTELSFMTGSQIRLDFLAGDTLNAEPESQNKYIVALYRTLSGWDDQPVARLVSVSEQNFLKDFAGYYRVQFYFLIIFVTLIMVIISIFLNHYLDRPIRTISASLEHNDPTLLEKIKSQSTEFGSIAQLINHFFMQKEKLIKEYEERIKAEQRSQNIIDNAPIGISFFRLRADGHLIFMGANPAADKILARNHLDYVGMTLDEVFPVLLETELPDAFRKVVMTGGHYHSAEVGVVSAVDRKIFDVKAFLYNPNMVAVFFQDISARKRTEEALLASETKFRNLVENMLDMVWQIDTNGCFTYVSPNVINILGFNASELIGQKCTEYLASEDRVTVEKALENLISRRQSIQGLSFNRIHKDGHRIAIELNAAPLIDSDGDCMGFVGICRDVTLRRQLEEEQIKGQKLESLGTLAGGIAHDFNNILTGILGNISLANMSTDDPTIKDLLGEAENASLEARDLVCKLLTFAKGGVPIKEKLTVEEFVRESVRFALSGTSIDVSYNFSADLPPLAADRTQLDQVIQNIVINAVQAMPDGGKIDIEVDTVSQMADLPPEADLYVRIRISDSGVGIPAENLKRIFDPYFTTKEFGSGMGLSAAYSIVKRHGGHISATSRKGSGATFSIFLPVEKSQSAKIQPSIQNISKSQGHILIMDDEKMILDVARAMLKKLGYTATCANEGRQALDIYRKAMDSGQAFDVVIMDLTIVGGMGGKDTIRELRKIDPGVPVIASSGYANDPIMAEPESYGFNGVISKPYNMQILGAELTRILKNKPIAGG